MKKLPILLALLLWFSGLPSAQAEPGSETVVLLHGLGRGPWVMKRLEQRLEDAGYRVHNLGYESRSGAIEDIVAEVHVQFRDCCAEASDGEVHFVTYSLGGLVLRAYLAEHRPPNLGRSVMLAPPNGGSEIVDRFGDKEWFGDLLGPLAPQLGTGPDDLPARLPPPDFELGVIAGDHWVNLVGRLVLPPPHDGTVSVQQTAVAGMRDHLVVPFTHTFIVNSKQVTREVIHFLRHGKFERAAQEADAGQANTASGGSSPAFR